MAIIVEEEKSGANIAVVVGWIVIIGIIGAAAYYIFFKAPELVILPGGGGAANFPAVSQFSVQPEQVLNSAAFQNLKESSVPLPTPQGPAPVGRSNPFVSP